MTPDATPHATPDASTPPQAPQLPRADDDPHDPHKPHDPHGHSGSPFPPAATPQLRRLDPRWVAAERASGLIGAGVLSVGGLVAAIIVADDHLAAWLGVWLFASAALAIAAMWAPAIQYRRSWYGAGPLGVEIRRGVLWRRITMVPRSRIQHTDVEQGPLLRRFGLAKLVIHTAGAEHATVPIYGLALEDAVAIRDGLIGAQSAAPEQTDGV